MLHLGCGPVKASGYINIDARPLGHVHFIVKDLRDIVFIPPGSVNLIYMCHVLEHVPHTETSSVIRAMANALKVGGTLRISVPDFEKMISIYESTGRDLSAIIGPLMGGQDYAQNFHYAAFNLDSLTRTMERSGFKGVREWKADEVLHHNFVDWSNREFEHGGRRFLISLNVEAVRG
jgi:2-polyprenyl-3-methyl-5-hydroxy-6-metoxy-1,4-benzoquinol methylase